MGWASGSTIAIAVIKTIQENVGDPDRRRYIYEDFINVMEDADWDTVDEAMGIDEEFDAAVYQIHPEWQDDYYDGEDEDEYE